MASIPLPIAIASLLGVGIVMTALVLKVTEAPPVVSTSARNDSAAPATSLQAVANANRPARLLALATGAAKAGNFAEAEQRRDEALKNGADRTAVEAVTGLIASEKSTRAAWQASQEAQRRAEQVEADARFQKAIDAASRPATSPNQSNSSSAANHQWKVTYNSNIRGRKEYLVNAPDEYNAWLATVDGVNNDPSNKWTERWEHVSTTMVRW